MKKQLVRIMFLLVTSLAVAVAFVPPVSAQDTNPTPTPMAGGGNSISLANLGKGEIQMVGPYDSQTVRFGLPANWKLLPGATLDLMLTTAFNAQGTGMDASVNGGMLTVRYNGMTIGMFPLSQVGNTIQRMPIPMDALLATHSDGRHDLTFVLDSGLNCDFNQHTQVVVLPSTTFTFPNEITSPDLESVVFSQTALSAINFP